MKSRSGSLVYEDAFKVAPEWAKGWFHIGDRVKWFGMLLRCDVDHYSGPDAKHPWDPGWGWGDGAALIWAVVRPGDMAAEADAARERVEAVRT
jgi:hypothetical protein